MEKKYLNQLTYANKLFLTNLRQHQVPIIIPFKSNYSHDLEEKKKREEINNHTARQIYDKL